MESFNGSMRVLFLVTRSDSFGGSSVHIRDMCLRLMAAGHKVLVGIGGEGQVTERYKEAGVPYRPLKNLVREVAPYTDLCGLLEVRRLIKEFKPDLVSAHTSKVGVLGRVAAWSCGVPAIYTPHCWSFTNGFPNAWLYLWAERLSWPFGKKIIMVSENERGEGIEGRVGTPSHLVTVHNGMPDIDGSLRADPGKKPPHLVMIGRYEGQKDQATLLRALGKLRDLPWTCDLVGEGPNREMLGDLLREQGLMGRVNLRGYRTDIPQILSKAQVYVLITHWEGFPRSIIEAMRAGLPVVATDVGGNAEAIVDGETGFIVPHEDPDSVAQALEIVIRDQALRVKMGKASRARYEQEFTFERMFQKTVRVYEEVIGRRVATEVVAAKPETGDLKPDEVREHGDGRTAGVALERQFQKSES
jgi:Glycosyltransferase